MHPTSFASCKPPPHLCLVLFTFICMLTYFKNVLLLPIVCIDVEIKYAWIELNWNILSISIWPGGALSWRRPMHRIRVERSGAEWSNSLNSGTQIHTWLRRAAALINDGTATHISNMVEQEQHSSSLRIIYRRTRTFCTTLYTTMTMHTLRRCASHDNFKFKSRRYDSNLLWFSPVLQKLLSSSVEL